MMKQETPISLESYAAVIAGLGAGLDLMRALDHAEVPPVEWDRAAAHWQSRIDESAATDLFVLVAFDGALLSAKRRFEPTFEPIESDPRAWSHFRRHFITAVDPLGFLAQRELSLATYARIEADWTERAMRDEALAAALKEHLEAPLEPCPTLTMIRSPLLAGKPAAARIPAPEAAPSPPSPPSEAVVPIAMIGETPPGAARQVSMDSPPPAIHSPPSASLGGTGDLPADLVARVAKGPLPFGKPPPSPSVSGPHVGTPNVVPGPATPPASSPRATQRSTHAFTTQELPVGVATKPALPFESAASPRKPPAAPALPAVQFETQEISISAVPEPMLPFTRASRDVPVPSAPPRSTPVAAGSALPFDPAASKPGVMGALPPPDGASVGAPAAKGANSEVAPAPPVPTLSLEQHASLHVELDLHPRSHAEVLRRYFVSQEQLAAIDATYHERMATDDALRTAWNAAYTAYRTWFIASSGKLMP